MRCRLCDGENLELYYTQGNNDQYKFYRCMDCKLVNYDLSTGLDQAKYGEFYVSPKDKRHPANKRQGQTYGFIKKHFHNQGSLLDIGCGYGTLLHLARNDGWEVHGFELSGFLAESIKKAMDMDVTVCNFLEYEAKEDLSYDLVVMRHVLEHLPDSRLAMNKINSLLKPNGYALLEFPNIEGFDLKLKRFLHKKGLHKKKYPAHYMPGHCNEFYRESFEFLLAKTGFRLEKWQTYSSNALLSPFYNYFKFGNKARALIRKKD